MKKIFLICVGCVLLWVTIQVILEMGGGMAAIYRKAEYTWYSYSSTRKHDPGGCARIGDDMHQGKPSYLRDMCFYEYMLAGVPQKNDCAAKEFLVDTVSIIKMKPADWFRQECLLLYYKNLVWSPQAENIEVCKGLSDRLIEFSYYRQNLRSKNEDTALSPGKNPFRTDVDLIEDCEREINKTSK